jgi:hypothetical protein
MKLAVSGILGEGHHIHRPSEYWGHPFSAGEDPVWAYQIAADSGKRFLPGEKAISRHPEMAYQYAKNIIRGRWPEGEAAIKRDPFKAYYYAKDTLKDRWPEAEKYIIRNDTAAGLYTFNVIHGPWPEAEEAIAKDSVYAILYAEKILKGRFFAGEKTIANSSQRDRYLRSFPEARDDWAMNGWIDWLDT